MTGRPMSAREIYEEIESGIALWQGYQFEPCDGFYDHIDQSHGKDYDLPDIDHAEAGLERRHRFCLKRAVVIRETVCCPDSRRRACGTLLGG